MKKSLIWTTVGATVIGFGVPAYAAVQSSKRQPRITTVVATATKTTIDDSPRSSIDDNGVDATTNTIDDNGVDPTSNTIDDHGVDATSNTVDDHGVDTAAPVNTVDDSGHHGGGDDSGHGGSDG